MARSIRAAFPQLRLVGVDFWPGSSGLHHDVFDDVWVKPSWDLIETEVYAAEIERELAAGNVWISTLDLEVAWMTATLAPHPRLLIPTEDGLTPTLKPRPAVAEMLPFPLPPSLDMRVSDAEIYEFCRRHSFRVWLKGPYHEAVAVTSWRQLEAVRTAMEHRWQTSSLSLQAHVRGYEESVCLAAHAGRLLQAIYMKKRLTTPDGKTWAGRVSPLPQELLPVIERTVAALSWTGGAELELLRDVDGKHWLMEWNPRFPAWIHGATLAGHNLPGALVGAALGLDLPRSVAAETPEFTRVVLEIPVKAGLPLPLPFEPDHGQLGAMGKYGAALSSVVPKLKPAASSATLVPSTEAVSTELTEDLLEAARLNQRTPARVFLPRAAAAGFAVAKRLGAVAVDGCRLRPGYSIKTSPDAEYLSLAREAGMLGECISMLEVERALAAGWAPGEIVLNGPGKWWPYDMTRHQGLRAVFCDSVEELSRLISSGRRDQLWGVRLRLPGFHSRFGVSVEEPAELTRLAALIAQIPAGQGFGVHVHLASTLIGNGHWLDAVQSAAVWAKALGDASGRAVTMFDLGGGYHPNDFGSLPFEEVVRFVRRLLPSVSDVLIEPGRALTQATMAVFTTVLDVRHRAGEIDEVVVDACIAELPLAGAYPHRWWRVGDDRAIEPLGRGRAKILGRICMEDDVLATGLAVPAGIKPGDQLIIGDAGAYERTMSYAFGRGGY